MSRTTNRKSLLVAAAAVLGATAPMMGADPWFKVVFGSGPDRGHQHGGWERRRPQPPILHCPPPVVYPVRHTPVEEVPCDLSFTAYQAGDTIIVIARGTNRAGGFCTSLSACETRGGEPLLLLRNTAPQHCGTACATPFEVSGSFKSHCPVSTIEVKIADTCRRIRVQQIGRIG